MPLAQSVFSQLAAGSGLTSIVQSSRDTKLLCLQRFVRLFAYGTSFLILVHFLSNLDIPDERIGLFMTMTLLGDVVISFILTSITDQVGRRKVLVAGSFLMAMSGFVFLFSSNYWLLLFASVIGVISPSGNEIGPFRAVEESILAQLTDKDKRSDIFAWYTLFGTMGAALGALLCGLAVQFLQDLLHWTETSAYRVVFLSYAILGVVKAALTLMLSSAVEPEPTKKQNEEEGVELEAEGLLESDSDEPGENSEAQPPRRSPSKPSIQLPLVGRITADKARSFLPTITPASRSILLRLSILFFMDSFASGLASPSWLTYFFTTIHSLKPSYLGTLFLVTNILASCSNLAALPLARRLGPLKTMVFTHLPSAIFLALIPLPPATDFGTWLAVAFLCLRACTQSMDQAPRQAFLSAAVLPTERTAVLGYVNIVKTLAQAGGLGSTGVMAGAQLWVLVLSGAGTLKALYDIMMLWMFLGVKDRESAAKESGGRQANGRNGNPV